MRQPIRILAAAALALLPAATQAENLPTAEPLRNMACAVLGAGFHAEAGRGATAVTQATVEIVDAGVRVVANVISFTRLAAFGLMHAALAAVVWDATVALWGEAAASVLAVLVFVLGNALTFALEALVAGVQALRLEYYELFSRIFAGEGRTFSPWHIPLDTPKEAPWRP